MAQETIDVGTTPNDGTGEPIRDAFVKVNNNFGELYAYLSTGALVVGNSTVNTVISNTGGLVSGNSTSNIVANSSLIKIGNSTTNSVLTSVQFSITANADVGNSVINTTSVFVGNSTVNSYISQTNLKISTTSSNSSLLVNSSVIFLGNSTVNAVANTTRVTVREANVTSNAFTLGSSSVGSSNFANGYSVLPNGLLMQWGYNSAVNSTANVTTFASVGGVAFTNLFSVSATSSDSANFVAVTAANSTTITLTANAATNTGVYWTAIGK